MNLARSRVLLVVSAAVLAATAVAWLGRGGTSGSADLVAVAPVAPSPTGAPPTTVPAAPPASEPTTTVPPQPIGPPVRVRVPAIGVDAPVVPVGLRPDGQMEVPPATEVGWYRLGPAPGGAGSAVLAAHVDFAGERGAFFDLRSVPVGAEVLVDTEGGTQRFTVTAREQIAKDAVQLDRYFTAEGPARLTLITCGGVFDPGARHYQDNIILTADPAR